MSTLCLQRTDVHTILDEINMHKPESKKAPSLTPCFKYIVGEMVGVTGIEPVTPSMSTKSYISSILFQNTDFIMFNKDSAVTKIICVYTISTTKKVSGKHR